MTTDIEQIEQIELKILRNENELLSLINNKQPITKNKKNKYKSNLSNNISKLEELKVSNKNKNYYNAVKKYANKMLVYYDQSSFKNIPKNFFKKQEAIEKKIKSNIENKPENKNPSTPEEYDQLLEKNIKVYKEQGKDVFPDNIKDDGIRSHLIGLFNKINNLKKYFPDLEKINPEQAKETLEKFSEKDLISYYNSVKIIYNGKIFLNQIKNKYIQLGKLSNETLKKVKELNKRDSTYKTELLESLMEEYPPFLMAFTNPKISKIEISDQYKKNIKTTIRQPVDINKNYKMYFYIIDSENQPIEDEQIRKTINSMKNKSIPQNIRNQTKRKNQNKTSKLKYNINRIGFPKSPGSKDIAKWIAYIKYNKDDTFVGVCHGVFRIYNEHVFSYLMMIELEETFQGKGLCKPFSNFIYNNLIRYADYIIMEIVSKVYILACMCYVKAAVLNNLKVYKKDKNEKEYTEIKNVKDCENINYYVKLIFSKDKINIKNIEDTKM